MVFSPNNYWSFSAEAVGYYLGEKFFLQELLVLAADAVNS